MMMTPAEHYQQSMQQGYDSFSLTTRRRHNPQSSGHSSSSVDIWKRHSQFNPELKQAQPQTPSSKMMVRSQSTDSINDLAESLLMDMSGNQSKMEDETHQIHSSRGEYFAPIPQLSHQSGNSMYSLANGNTQNSANLSNGDTKSMIIMPNLQPNRYQAPPQQQHLPHPTPLPHSHQGDQQAQLPQQQQSHYQQFIPHNQQQNSNQPFYYQKQPSYHQPSQNVTPTVGAQSLPYMSRSISVDSYSPASPPSVVQQLNTTNANKEVTPFSKKIPRNCELEEYARRYEALQRQKLCKTTVFTRTKEEATGATAENGK
jgi:hypothetical protein